MNEFLPILILGSVIGVLTLIFSSVYLIVKHKEKAFDIHRNMSDGVIIRRLLRYAKPYAGKFVLVLVDKRLA